MTGDCPSTMSASLHVMSSLCDKQFSLASPNTTLYVLLSSEVYFFPKVVGSILSSSFQELLSTISGRIPESVEEVIHRLLANYASNITSVLCQFPSQEVSLQNLRIYS